MGGIREKLSEILMRLYDQGSQPNALKEAEYIIEAQEFETWHQAEKKRAYSEGYRDGIRMGKRKYGRPVLTPGGAE